MPETRGVRVLNTALFSFQSVTIAGSYFPPPHIPGICRTDVTWSCSAGVWPAVPVAFMAPVPLVPVGGGVALCGVPVGGVVAGGVDVGGVPEGGMVVGGVPAGGVDVGGIAVGGVPAGGVPAGGGVVGEVALGGVEGVIPVAPG